MSRKNRTTLSFTPMESNTGYAPLGKEKAKGLGTRVNIRVTSYRKRTHDPDGISVKAVLDGLVRRGILPDDSTKWVKEITFQSIITKGEEKTVIEILEA